MERSLAVLWKILRPGGFVILGWNTDRIVDPLTLSNFKLFRYNSTLPVAGRVSFSSSTHVYDFLQPRIMNANEPFPRSGILPRV
jgi:hypothetical protein